MSPFTMWVKRWLEDSDTTLTLNFTNLRHDVQAF
jgi:hypothetical protein